MAIRQAADDMSFKSFTFEPASAPSTSVGGTLVWIAGEKLIRGSAADIRRALYSPVPVDSNIIVHIPYAPEFELLSVQPRIRFRGAKRAWLNLGIRIESIAAPSPAVRKQIDATPEPWAHLYKALLFESKQIGLSLEALKDLWQRPHEDQAFAALILHNLIAVLVRLERYDQATEMLTLAAKAFPSYAEILFLHGLLLIKLNKASKAIPMLESALKLPSSDFPGSGGENSYRSLFLLGHICEQAGRQEKAVRYWLPAVNERPAFPQAVHALLNQRIPKHAAEQISQPLGEMARREPVYADLVMNFFVEHGLVAQARRLLNVPALDESARFAIEQRITERESRMRARPPVSKDAPGIILHGPFGITSAHSRINEAIALSVLRDKHFDVGLQSAEWPTTEMMERPTGEILWNAMSHTPRHTDLTIRHMWPPNFTRPSDGKLACILPWEHSAVPRGWVKDIEKNVDELWVPSEFVRRAFVSGGVKSNRIHALPNGVDTRIFNPAGPKFKPPGGRSFIFLFVGGTIRRKGIDLLLRAYGEAFTREDDVTFVIKDLGSRSFYSQNSQINEVTEFARRPKSPHLLLLTDQFDDAMLASLYRGADAFVLPYRAEGFGMPLLEAIACGTPVISTGAGPLLEYCSAEDAFLIDAQEVPVPEQPPPLGEFSGPWTWFEPDFVSLTRTMLRVFESREDARRRGQRAGERVRAEMDWTKILPLYHQRIRTLTGIGADDVS